MESVLARTDARWPRALSRFDARAASVWGLSAAVVLYLGLDGGGYDIIVRNQIGVVVWWAVLVAAIWGLVPAGRLTRTGMAAVALLGGFVLWTALASGWSQSSERTLDELSRDACYLGVLVLAVMVHRDRERALRHTVGAIAMAVVAVAAIALLSRLRPGTFTGPAQTASLLPGSQGRLAWPLNYWNGLGALMALGLPLLLAVAFSARRLGVQVAAVGAMPLVALCGYLTFSRGSALAASGAMIVFFALTGDRVPKLLTAGLVAGASAVLVAGAVHRSAIENALVGSAARHQGGQLFLATILVCAGTAIAQLGIALAVRHGTPPRWLQVSRARARLLLIGALAVGVAVAIAAGAPSRISTAWRDFKRPDSAVLHRNGIGRFGATSGNGRYQYWKVAVDATPKHAIGGWGPGTFQFVWLPRGRHGGYVTNAHSLYIETLVEDGIVGLAILAGFFLLILWRAVARAARSRYEERTLAAAAAGACVAFSISAAADWVWQLPVLPVCFLLLGAAVLAPARRALSVGAHARSEADGGAVHRLRRVSLRRVPLRWRGISLRGALVALALACLVAIVVPLAMTSALRRSQAAAASGDEAKALSYAQVAARIEPGAASAQLQEALVLEVQGKLAAAAAAARHATADEPLNWSAWFVLSRLDVETGQPAAAVSALRRARSLNPLSPLFSQ